MFSNCLNSCLWKASIFFSRDLVTINKKYPLLFLFCRVHLTNIFDAKIFGLYFPFANMAIRNEALSALKDQKKNANVCVAKTPNELQRMRLDKLMKNHVCCIVY